MGRFAGGQEQPEQGLWGARVAPTKVPPPAACLRCDTKTQSVSLVCAFMGQAVQRGFKRGWLGPLKSQTERQLPTPKHKSRSLSVKMQSGWLVRTGPASMGCHKATGAWALVPGSKLWRNQMFTESCTSVLDCMEETSFLGRGI